VILKYRHLKIASLWSLWLLKACASNDLFENKSVKCDRLKPSEFCASQSKASIYVEVPQIEVGAEYIIFVHPSQMSPIPERNQHEILMVSNISSDLPPHKEQEKQRILIQKSQDFVSNATDEEVVDEDAALPLDLQKPLASRLYELKRSDFRELNTSSDEIAALDLELAANSLSEALQPLSSDAIRFIRMDDNPNSLARSIRLHPRRLKSSGLFEILFDQSLNDANLFSNFKEIQACIGQQFEKIFKVLGKPIDLDQKEEVEILVTNIGHGPSGGTALGFFNPLDRYRFDRNQKEWLGNFGEMIYVSPRQSNAMTCATAAHELQHLINYDSKITRILPPGSREDRSTPQIYSLRQEDHGLNEAFSHLIEILTGEADDHVQKILLQILRNPHQSNLSLELSGHNIFSNFRTRGLNLLILLHALKRFGGSLSWDDPKTQEFLRLGILSPSTGFDNLGKIFNESGIDHLRNFLRAWALALYSDTGSFEFMAVDDENPDRLVRVLNRYDDLDTLQRSRGSKTFHPMESQIPFLQQAQAWISLSRGISMYRFIVPQTLPPSTDSSWNLEVRSTSSPIEFLIVRVR